MSLSGFLASLAPVITYLAVYPFKPEIPFFPGLMVSVALATQMFVTIKFLEWAEVVDEGGKERQKS